MLYIGFWSVSVDVMAEQTEQDVAVWLTPCEKKTLKNNLVDGRTPVQPGPGLGPGFCELCISYHLFIIKNFLKHHIPWKLLTQGHYCTSDMAL